MIQKLCPSQTSPQPSISEWFIEHLFQVPHAAFEETLEVDLILFTY